MMNTFMKMPSNSLKIENGDSKRSTEKKIRVRKKKKREIHSRKNYEYDSISSLFFLLAGLSLLVYVYGFVKSVLSLPGIDRRIDNLDIRGKMSEKSGIYEKIFSPALFEKIAKTYLSEKELPVDRNEDTEKDPKPLEAVELPDDGGLRKKKSPENKAAILPEAKWPVSIRNEAGDFEDIIHPGDHKTTLSVPKFWSPPLVGEDGNVGSLMSRDVATRFGSYTDGSFDTDYRNKNSPDKRTIFVAIASYRDWQCRYTVESLLNMARFPERVRIAVVDQITEEDPSCGVPIKSCVDDPNQGLCKYKDNVDVMEVDAQLAVGPVFARHIGHRMYRGEYYAMQIDAHVTFIIDWDVDIIKQLEATKNEMAVLSTYLTDIVGSIDEKTGKSLRATRPIMCNTDYEGGAQGKHLRHMSQPESVAQIKDMPQMQPYWAAGWSFSRGHFVVNIPYDLYLPMIFMGEESSIGIRGFTYGYDHYASQRSICFHSYANGENAKIRGKVPHFWENSRKYSGVGVPAMKRLLGIIHMNPEVNPSEWEHTDEKLYGIGTERDVSKFFDTFGIHVKEKTVEHNLCQFVQTGRMHRTFLPFLRSNEMGIDYSKINFKFVDPAKRK